MASIRVGIHRGLAAPAAALVHGLAACALAWAPASAAEDDEEYDALIIQARQGIYDPALAMLRQRDSLNPQDLRAILALLVIPWRAGRSAEVIDGDEAVAMA